MKKKQIIILVLVFSIAAIGYFGFIRKSADLPSSNVHALDKELRSTDDPGSIWVVVNKRRLLQPATYAPNDLVIPKVPLRSNITEVERYVRFEAANALESMVQDAQSEGIHLNLLSGYRSFDFQVALYNRYVREQGKAVADTQSARPGFSEHQTGLAVDLGSISQPKCDIEECFANTQEGQWLALNSYQYGFIHSYPKGEEDVTGYVYEPWHVRYVGKELAGTMHDQDIDTLEMFFDLGKAPDYK